MSPEIHIIDDNGKLIKKVSQVTRTQLLSVGLDIWRQNRKAKVNVNDDEDLEFFQKIKEISDAFISATFKNKKKK